jgi:hypothetical protein
MDAWNSPFKIVTVVNVPYMPAYKLTRDTELTTRPLDDSDTTIFIDHSLSEMDRQLKH